MEDANIHRDGCDKLLELYQGNSAARYVIDTLESNGFEAFIVGGAVRDTLLGMEPKDVDIATSANPDEVTGLFNVVIPTGIDFGTVTVMVGKVPIEVTTYRSDGRYDDGRRPNEISYCSSIVEDLSRRDFTMNAVAYSPTRGMVDPFLGMSDLKDRVIRCVGSPLERFAEDRLRILRALRFAIVYGFTLDYRTEQAMHLWSDPFSGVSCERVGAELSKMLRSPNVNLYISPFQSLFIHAIPEMSVMKGYDQHNRHHMFTLWGHMEGVLEGMDLFFDSHDADDEIVIAMKLAAILHDIGKPHCQSEKSGEWHYYGHEDISADIAETVLTRMAFPRTVVDLATTVIKFHGYPLEGTVPSVLRIMNRMDGFGRDDGEAYFLPLLLLKVFDRAGKGFYPDLDRVAGDLGEVSAVCGYPFKSIMSCYRKIMDEHLPYAVRMLPITGTDLMEFTGRKSGSWIGKTLDVTLRHVMNGKTLPDRDSVLEDALKLSRNF